MDDLVKVGEFCKKTGELKQNLYSAIHAGSLQKHRSEDGALRISMSEALEWRARIKRRGKKPKEARPQETGDNDLAADGDLVPISVIAQRYKKDHSGVSSNVVRGRIKGIKKYGSWLVSQKSAADFYGTRLTRERAEKTYAATKQIDLARLPEPETPIMKEATVSRGNVMVALIPVDRLFELMRSMQ